MRAFVLVPIVLAVAFAAAIGICRAIGIDAHLRDLLAATLTCLVAGELAIIPLMLSRGANQAGVAQAALVGSVVHLFVCIAVAGVVVFARLGPGPVYLYWLLGFYWVTLIVLVVAFAKSIRSAPAVQASRQ
jgi:hypothetical protein